MDCRSEHTKKGPVLQDAQPGQSGQVGQSVPVIQHPPRSTQA